MGGGGGVRFSNKNWEGGYNFYLKIFLGGSVLKHYTDYVFPFFQNIKGFEILCNEVIFTLLSLSSLFTHLDYCHNTFNIANDSLHIVFQKGVSNFSKIALFSFNTTLKFDVRKFVISFNKQSHNLLTRSKFKNRRHPFVEQLFGNISGKFQLNWLKGGCKRT